jgi:hypothetical protein
MSKLILKNIISSNNVTLLETNNDIFVTHIESEDTINPLDDYKLVVSGVSTVSINNIYPLSTFVMQSYQYKKIPSERQNNILDFLEIYGPNVKYIKGCQFFNTGYLLSELTNNSITFNSTEFSGDIFSTPYIQSTELPIETYMYPSSSIIISAPDTSISEVSGQYTQIPLYNLSGIQFNFINECPLEFKYAGFNTVSASSYIFSDTFNTKNNYNSDYAVAAVITSSTDLSTVNANLSNAREYFNIGSTGDILYAVYKTNKYYETSDSVSLSSNITGVTYGMTPTSSFATTGHVVQIPLDTVTSGNISVYDKYDNVETIHSVNRIKEPVTHKSNLFSINIQNSNINTSALSDADKESLKQNLNNIINNIIKNITPANTQLFKIYWNGN